MNYSFKELIASTIYMNTDDYDLLRRHIAALRFVDE